MPLPWRASLGLLAFGALTVSVVWGGLARREGSSRGRCALGLVALGPRCCGQGQRLEEGRCVGEPSRCASGMERTPEGCVLAHEVVQLPGGTLREAPSDWEAEGVVRAREVEVPAFGLDAAEVNEVRYAACVRAGACAPLASSGEPGRPQAGATASEAQAFCTWLGGRLPTPEELAFAAAGPKGRRYPWGAHGAVCRRAAFGLVEGPCAEGARGPDLGGARPEGRSPEGLWDLSGNLAEWALTAGPEGPESPESRGIKEPEERGRGSTWAEVRGGSYADAEASALKAWGRREVDPNTRSTAVGFRCAYAPGPLAPSRTRDALP